MKKTFKEFEEFVRNIPPEKFDYRSLVNKWEDNTHTCGSICCAAGWLPKFDPVYFEYDITKEQPIRYKGVDENAYPTLASSMSVYFNIDIDTILDIFFYDFVYQVPITEITPAIVADKMLEYINKN